MFQPRMSTKWPATAAADAMIGLTRCVRPPCSCLPSKFRFDVLAHRSPGARMSGFIPRHMLQPDSLHSNPASLKTLGSPRFSASYLTICDPGTTMARTPGATFLPLITFEAATRSSSRELVHDPMKTRSTLIDSISSRVPGPCTPRHERLLSSCPG